MEHTIFNKNKLWIITLVVFVVLITFLDSSSILDKIQLNSEISKLKAQKSYYLDRIAEDSAIMNNLKDDDFLERYGRENCFMRKKGEIIYIIQE